MVMGVSADFHSMLMQLEQFVAIHQIYSASTFFYVPIVLTSNVGCWHVKSGFHASSYELWNGKIKQVPSTIIETNDDFFSLGSSAAFLELFESDGLEVPFFNGI